MLPRQLLGDVAFSRMLRTIGGNRHRFEDFRENGLLLPCEELSAMRMGLPMHRGPHRLYSELVAARVGQIERTWAATQCKDPQAAAIQAHMRLDLLQRALRRYLLDGQRRRLKLNRRDPVALSPNLMSLMRWLMRCGVRRISSPRQRFTPARPGGAVLPLQTDTAPPAPQRARPRCRQT
nr:AHH domain-containing protein [Novosphingobium guangzhouense]